MCWNTLGGNCEKIDASHLCLKTKFFTHFRSWSELMLLACLRYATSSPKVRIYIATTQSGNCGRRVQMINVWAIAGYINGVGNPGDREIFKWGTVKYTSAIIESYSHIDSLFWRRYLYLERADHLMCIQFQQRFYNGFYTFVEPCTKGITKLISIYPNPISFRSATARQCAIKAE